MADNEAIGNTAGFVGGLTRQSDPPSQTFAANTKYYLQPPPDHAWTTTVTDYINVGDNNHVIPVRVRLPATGDTNLVNGIEYIFHDGTKEVVEASELLSNTDRTFQDTMDNLLGGATESAKNNGKSIATIRFFARNDSGSDITQDHNFYKIRALNIIRGKGETA